MKVGHLMLAWSHVLEVCTICELDEPTHHKVRNSWKDTEPSSDMCALGAPLYSENVDCESGFGALGQFSDLAYSQRNYTNGRIKFYWKFGEGIFLYRVSKRVMQFMRHACSALRGAVHDLRRVWQSRTASMEMGSSDKVSVIVENVYSRVQDEIGALRLEAQEGQWVQLVDPLNLVIFDGSHSLQAVSAALLSQVLARIAHSTRSTQLSEAVIRAVDEEFYHLMYALYLAQVVAGFFSCLEPTQNALAPRYFRCSADGRWRGTGLEFRYHATASHRAHYITQLLRRSETGRVLEIGVNKGSSAHWILDRHDSLQYVGVDPFFNDDKKYSDVLGRLGRHIKTGSGTILRGVLADVDPRSIEPADIVFIDGDHVYEAVVSDINLASRFLHPAGIISGHDFSPWHLDIMTAVITQAGGLGHVIHLGMDFVWWLAPQNSVFSANVEHFRTPSRTAAIGNLSSVIDFERVCRVKRCRSVLPRLLPKCMDWMQDVACCSRCYRFVALSCLQEFSSPVSPSA